MSIFVEIAITVISWFAIVFLGTPMIGVFTRSFFHKSELENDGPVDAFIAHEHLKLRRRSVIISSFLIVTFLVILGYFWNVILSIAGFMIMSSRALDVYWEMNSGEALALGNMRKPRFFLLSTVLAWSSLPVIWYSIYRF